MSTRSLKDTRWITVRTVIREATELETATHKRIDWNDSSDRKWLQSHTHWAICNGASITLTPVC